MVILRMVRVITTQDMDEQRVKCIQTFMRKSAQTEQVTIPGYWTNNCLWGWFKGQSRGAILWILFLTPLQLSLLDIDHIPVIIINQ